MTDRKNPDLSALEELLECLQDLSEGLGKLNDAYPATREFLERKGVASVNDLDKAGRTELRLHLENTLELALSSRKKPSKA